MPFMQSDETARRSGFTGVVLRAFGEVDRLRPEPQAEVAAWRRGARRLETRFQGPSATLKLCEDALSGLFERFLLGHAKQCNASASLPSSAFSGTAVQRPGCRPGTDDGELRHLAPIHGSDVAVAGPWVHAGEFDVARRGRARRRRVAVGLVRFAPVWQRRRHRRLDGRARFVVVVTRPARGQQNRNRQQGDEFHSDRFFLFAGATRPRWGAGVLLVHDAPRSAA